MHDFLGFSSILENLHEIMIEERTICNLCKILKKSLRTVQTVSSFPWALQTEKAIQIQTLFTYFDISSQITSSTYNFINFLVNNCHCVLLSKIVYALKLENSYPSHLIIIC